MGSLIGWESGFAKEILLSSYGHKYPLLAYILFSFIPIVTKLFRTNELNDLNDTEA